MTPAPPDDSSIPMSTIPGMTEATFENWYGYPSHKDPDPFLAQLPGLTADMSSPDGPLSEYCPGYAWAAKVRAALNAAMGAEIQIPAGDDSADPGAAPTGAPGTWPGIYTPSVGATPGGGGFTGKAHGVTYLNLCFRMHVKPPTGAPYLTDGYNVTLIVRQFLAEPNNIVGVLALQQAQILAKTPRTPLS